MELEWTDALRFLGRALQQTDVDQALLQEATEEILCAARPRVVAKRGAFARNRNGLAWAGVSLAGTELARRMAGCDEGVLVAATVGAQVDGCIDRAGIRSPLKQLLLDACASAAIERVMDDWQKDLRAACARDGLFVTDRYSPGYGDWPIEAQKEILGALDAPRAIGLYLTDSFLMVPRKSVTALAGISKEPVARCREKCEDCAMFGRCAYGGRGDIHGKPVS